MTTFSDRFFGALDVANTDTCALTGERGFLVGRPLDRTQDIISIMIMPEKNLVIIKPLLSALAEPLYTIEPASPEESKKAEKYIREYEKNPSSFAPFKKSVSLCVPCPC